MTDLVETLVKGEGGAGEFQSLMEGGVGGAVKDLESTRSIAYRP